MAEDLGGPDSWEAADLGKRLSKFLVSPTKKSTISPSPPESFSDEPTTDPSASLRDGSVGREGGIADDALNQVDQFLREALEKPRERLSILRMERDIEKFIRDPTQQQLEFQSLPTSYLRLAAHRVAQHYYLQSVAMPDSSSSIDGSGSRIVLCKASECRFPLVRLADVPVNLPDDDNSNNNNTVVKLAIKQRPQKHSQNISSGSSIHSSKSDNQKSVEERKEEYNRARARIFNNNSSIGFMEQSEAEATLPDSFPLFSLVPTGHNGRSGGVEGMVSCDHPCTGSSIPYRNRTEDEPSRYRVSNRVAIFRDREVDRKDPDYDRNYDRYMQRFDPGFGFNGGGPYALQLMYAPVVNYNSEFPHFGLINQVPQIPMDHQSRPILSGPWSATGYGHLDVMMAPFGPNHAATSSPYGHSSQYSVPPRHAMSFAPHPHDHVFTQSRQQQHEASFGVARPR